MNTNLILREENIIRQIYFIRGEKVMLDFDLAQLYQVETKYLKRQVRRNIERFPEDFMFELTKEEYRLLRSQIGSLENIGKGKYSKYLPYAFTEQGIAMLSGILNSSIAVEVNIAIMRTFVHLRKLIDSNRNLAEKIDKLESKLKEKTEKYDKDIALIFEAIRQLMQPPNPPRKRIGFKIGKSN
ncbi:MAG: ORF6N domain-containing protein [Bacteroidetes bacterium]|nr:ORF6N domain-containing protein [Bacteroidota bacterium]